MGSGKIEDSGNEHDPCECSQPYKDTYEINTPTWFTFLDSSFLKQACLYVCVPVCLCVLCLLPANLIPLLLCLIVPYMYIIQVSSLLHATTHLHCLPPLPAHTPHACTACLPPLPAACLLPATFTHCHTFLPACTAFTCLTAHTAHCLPATHTFLPHTLPAAVLPFSLSLLHCCLLLHARTRFQDKIRFWFFSMPLPCIYAHACPCPQSPCVYSLCLCL